MLISLCPAPKQAYPTKRALAEAFKGRLGGSGEGRRKLSRLKRVILRERADKTAADAKSGAEAAAAAAGAALAFRDSFRLQLKVPGPCLVSCVPVTQDWLLPSMAAIAGACLHAGLVHLACKRLPEVCVISPS